MPRTNHIFFHDDADGIISAYMLRESLLESNFLLSKVNHGTPISLDQIKRGDTVYFVDFTPQVDVCLVIEDKMASKLVILDHHNVNKLIEEIRSKLTMSTELYNVFDETGEKKAFGAIQVVASYLFGKEALTERGELVDLKNLPYGISYLIERVARRDVWNFDLVHTREICEAFSMLCPMPENSHVKISKWMDELASFIHNKSMLITMGTTLLSKQQTEIARILPNARRWTFKLPGKEPLQIYGVFTDKYISEVGSELLKNEDAAWGGVVFIGQIVDFRLRFSFRSKGGQALSLAKMFGGNGQADAAGSAFLLIWRMISCTGEIEIHDNL